jgi:hypothetical protein
MSDIAGGQPSGIVTIRPDATGVSSTVALSHSISTMRRCHEAEPVMPVINSTSFGLPPQPLYFRRPIRSPTRLALSRNRQMRLGELRFHPRTSRR